MKKYMEQVQKIKEEERLKKLKHQNDLKYQIQMKEQAKLLDKQNQLYEERAAQLWEKEYQKKISEQKEKHLQRVN